MRTREKIAEEEEEAGAAEEGAAIMFLLRSDDSSPQKLDRASATLPEKEEEVFLDSGIS